jgi:hypothetical protein
MADCLHKRVVKRGRLVVCAECGKDIERWYAASVGSAAPAPSAEPAAVPAATSEPAPPRPHELLGIPLRALLVLGVGLAVGLVIVSSGNVVNLIIHTLTTLAHELGHAVAGWMLGRPSLPAFDFRYGGGVTAVGNRSPLLLGGYAAALIALLWLLRRQRRGCTVLASVGLAIFALALSDAGLIVIVSAGHDGEVVLAAIFLYRALSGVAVVSGGERWLYAIVGWTVLLHSIVMCWTVAFDESAKERYFMGKGGIDNDFVVIAFTQGWNFETVAVVHLLFSLLAIPLVGVAWIWRARISATFYTLFAR